MRASQGSLAEALFLGVIVMSGCQSKAALQPSYLKREGGRCKGLPSHCCLCPRSYAESPETDVSPRPTYICLGLAC